MSFKVSRDPIADRPLVVCDVCSEPILDVWSSKATASPVNGQTVDVQVSHRECPTPSGTTTIALIDFLRLLVVQNRLGDLASNGLVDQARVEYPTGKGFEA